MKGLGLPPNCAENGFISQSLKPSGGVKEITAGVQFIYILQCLMCCSIILLPSNTLSDMSLLCVFACAVKFAEKNCGETMSLGMVS